LRFLLLLLLLPFPVCLHARRGEKRKQVSDECLCSRDSQSTDPAAPSSALSSLSLSPSLGLFAFSTCGERCYCGLIVILMCSLLLHPQSNLFLSFYHSINCFAWFPFFFYGKSNARCRSLFLCVASFLSLSFLHSLLPSALVFALMLVSVFHRSSEQVVFR
jgi:hypothetical protein